MRSGWRVGTVFGIPLLLDTSWFLILALVTFLYGSEWQLAGLGGWAWIAGFLMAIALFSSVLLHELGHSLVARSQGIPVTSITLFLFGGIAAIDQESKTPGQAFQVAIAGPAVSFSLFVVLSLIRIALPLPQFAIETLTTLAEINLVLALFNMIPGLPLDGGQVLKAAIWKVTGSRLKGVRWAARVGQAIGWTAIVLGVIAYLPERQFGFLWMALLGWFGVRNASAYLRVTHLQQTLIQLKASDAMTREFRVVDADTRLRQFADEILLNSTLNAAQSEIYYAASDGRYRGLVQVEALQTLDRSRWEVLPLLEIVLPLDQIPSIAESASLKQVIEQLETRSLRRITVLSPAGAVAGVIDRGDILKALGERLNLAISADLIKQIKENGVYPPELQLGAIAKSAMD
jgi:Zn-dependent protease